MTRVAVVGHVEWVDFVRVPRYPPRGGLEHGERVSEHAGGGAVVASAALARLGAEVELFCALGDDERARTAARELADWGITVHAARRSGASRYAFTQLDAGAERTIVTVGERMQPAGSDDLEWERLARVDGVYFTAGDAAALERARRAPVVVVTPRAGDHEVGLAESPPVDATVFSSGDDAEARWAADWEARSRLMVATEGAAGGRWWGESSGHWTAAPIPGEVRDSYGCGDSFAAGFTFGLARGGSVDEAAAVGARCAAEMLTRVGAP